MGHRGIRQSVRLRPKSRLADTFRPEQQFFALSTARIAVRKCASVSDRTEEKHFFEKNFSNDILYMTKIIVMKGEDNLACRECSRTNRNTEQALKVIFLFGLGK